MQKHPLLLIAALSVGLCLQSCGSAAASVAPTASAAEYEPATATATRTIAALPTSTSTRTRLPTLARTPPPSATPKPTSACGGIASGWWASDEVVETSWTTTPFPMVQFHVLDCSVSEFTLVVYPSHGHLFEADLTAYNGAIRDSSFSVSFDNPGGAGALSICGDFPSNRTFQGYLMFSSGFQIGDFYLPETATIPFHAELALGDS